MSACLSVVEPCSTGVGGDCFLLVYESKTHTVFGLNGSGRSPSDPSFTQEGIRQILGCHMDSLSAAPMGHGLCVTVPGAVQGWLDAIERWGSRALTLSDIFGEAIRLAEEGFVVGRVTSYCWNRGSKRLGDCVLLPNGEAPAEGAIMFNKPMANLLRRISLEGRCAFYEGLVARKIVDAVQLRGGLLAEIDLKNHKSVMVETPISIVYRNEFVVHEVPPNSQGIAALIALKILNKFDPKDEDFLHFSVCAMRVGSQLAGMHVCDNEDNQGWIRAVLDDESFADKCASMIKAGDVDLRVGVTLHSSDTVSFQVVDKWGNAVSFVNSTYMDFGSGIVPDGEGFSLQNRGCGFRLEPKNHANCAAPNKRPFHTIIPCIVTRVSDGSLFATLTNMGGFMQPQGHVQLITAMVDRGMDSQSAVDQPRWCITNNSNGEYELAIEEGFREDLVNNLKRKGHPVKIVAGFERTLFGRAQIIKQISQSGVLQCGSDKRADGCALAY